MFKQCGASSKEFEITDADQSFYQRIGVPAPTLSPEERMRRRFAFRNERNLYRRTCAGTGESIISVYSEDFPGTVYSKDYWWSDNWDARSYGREFDFSKPFFPQYFELHQKVPRMSIILTHCENCDYAPYCAYCRNCYLAISCVESEDVHYCYQTNKSQDCLDCGFSTGCELCYECLYCVNCYNLRYSQYCENCSDSWFLKNCIGCSNCFGCVNLRNKEYYFCNKYLGREQYLAKMDALALSNSEGIEKLQRDFLKFVQTMPHRYMFGTHNIDVSGDNIHHSQNAKNCFDAIHLEDCKYIYILPAGAKDCYDIHFAPNAELTYEGMSAVANYNTKFVLHCWDLKESAYCDECFYSSNLLAVSDCETLSTVF